MMANTNLSGLPRALDIFDGLHTLPPQSPRPARQPRTQIASSRALTDDALDSIVKRAENIKTDYLKHSNRRTSVARTKSVTLMAIRTEEAAEILLLQSLPIHIYCRRSGHTLRVSIDEVAFEEALKDRVATLVNEKLTEILGKQISEGIDSVPSF